MGRAIAVVITLIMLIGLIIVSVDKPWIIITGTIIQIVIIIAIEEMHRSRKNERIKKLTYITKELNRGNFSVGLNNTGDSSIDELAIGISELRDTVGGILTEGVEELNKRGRIDEYKYTGLFKEGVQKINKIVKEKEDKYAQIAMDVQTKEKEQHKAEYRNIIDGRSKTITKVNKEESGQNNINDDLMKTVVASVSANNKLLEVMRKQYTQV